MKYFRQCRLQKGPTTQTAWLEEKAGLCEGAVVEIKSEVAGDKDGWKVMSMGGRTDQDFLNMHHVQDLPSVTAKR